MDMSHALDPKQAIWRLLPVHPPPQPFESLSSYVSRLQEANGLQSLKELAILANTRWSRFTSFPDYPSPPYQGLALITGYTEGDLENMTFHPIARQFGWSLHIQPLRRFLQSSLAPTLRYCPHCLAEQSAPYYSLLWRFSAITGCARHECRLLDHCTHCKARIPLVPAPSQCVFCPTCQRDLRMCQTSQLPQEMGEFNQRHTLSLERLLSSQLQLREAQAASIGSRLASLRYERRLTIEGAHDRIGMDEILIVQMENGNTSKVATFSDYQRYAHGLDSSLGEIVDALLLQQSLPLEEKKLLQQVDEIAQRLHAQGTPTTPMKIAKQIGLPLQRLRGYSLINSLLVVWEDERRQKMAQSNTAREEELVQRMKQIIHQLEHSGKPVTQQSITQSLGMSYQGIRIYPQVEAMLMDFLPQSGGQKSRLAARRERRRRILSP